MAQYDLIVRDLKQWLTGVNLNDTRRAGADGYSASTLNALRSILIEIEQAAVYVAISTSIAGIIRETHETKLNVRSIMSYRPPSPNAYTRHMDCVIAAGVDPVVLLPIQAFHTRLSFALRLSRAILDAGPAPTHVVHSVEFERLEEAWRHVCGTALIAISVLRETLASVRFSRPPVSNEHAEALLRSAKAGGRPCIGKDGTVTMPKWAESRIHARHAINKTATLLIGDKSQQVSIENVSRSGVGLIGLQFGTCGDAVTLQLDSGEKLEGRIMWERSGRVGVQLVEMLSPNHVLIAQSPARDSRPG